MPRDNPVLLVISCSISSQLQDLKQISNNDPLAETTEMQDLSQNTVTEKIKLK